MRSLLIVIGIGFAAIAGYFLFHDHQTESLAVEQTSGTKTALASPEPRNYIDRLSSEPEQENHIPDRVVGADRIPVPDVASTQLERLPPREPLSKLASRTSGKEGKQLLYRPVASIAGVIEAQGYSIQIAGIETVSAEYVCHGEGADVRPCGKQALTAFRGWLRGRAIECDLGDGKPSEQMRAPCSLGGKDAGTWLVENGWAYAEAGSKYVALEITARENGLGVFAKSK